MYDQNDAFTHLLTPDTSTVDVAVLPTTLEQPVEVVVPVEQNTYVADDMVQNVAFVAVTVHRWHGQYQIPENEVILEDSKDRTALKKGLTTKPCWKLMPDVWHESFTKVDSKVKKLLTQFCVLNPEQTPDKDGEAAHRFPIRGVHILPRKNLQKFFAEIRAIEHDEFKPLVAKFGEAWKDIIAKLKDSLKGQPPSAWRVFAHLPMDADEVTSKFYFEKVLIPINLGKDAVSFMAGAETDEYVNEIKAYGERFTKQVTDTIITGLEDELKLAVDNLVNRIEAGGVIREGTLNMVRTAFDKFRGFDFLMTPELKAKMGAAAVTLGEYNCHDLNKDLKDSGAASVTVKLSDHLREVRTQCVADTEAVRACGRTRRSIKV